MAALKRNTVKRFCGGVGLSDDQREYRASRCADADPMPNYVELDLVHPGARPALGLSHSIRMI